MNLISLEWFPLDMYKTSAHFAAMLPGNCGGWDKIKTFSHSLNFKRRSLTQGIT